MTRTGIASLLALGLLGCAEAGKYTDQASRATVDTLLPVAEENKIGKQLSAELEKKVSLLASEPVQQYIRSLGGKVVAAAQGKPKGIRFTFKVIADDKTVNAFAMPGGFVYVYTGLLKKASDEAELMSVLSHEVSHVTERHVAERLIAANGIQVVTELALGAKPDLLGQLVAGIVSNGFLLTYSRDQEREADSKGLATEVKAGYDPNGFVSFFKKLDDGTPALLAILSSHPATQERIASAQTWIRQHGSVPTERGAAAYQAMRAQLP
ncbi:MAG: M48 family metallopeptidase [Pseudomonadota bacterium]